MGGETPKQAPEGKEKQVREILEAFNALQSIYGKMDSNFDPDHAEVDETAIGGIDTENYHFNFFKDDLKNHKAPRIEITKKNHDGREGYYKITVVGMDSVNLKIFGYRSTMVGEKEDLIGSVSGRGHDRGSVEVISRVKNLTQVHAVLTKFSGILTTAYRKREKEKNKPAADF